MSSLYQRTHSWIVRVPVRVCHPWQRDTDPPSHLLYRHTTPLLSPPPPGGHAAELQHHKANYEASHTSRGPYSLAFLNFPSPIRRSDKSRREPLSAFPCQVISPGSGRRSCDHNLVQRRCNSVSVPELCRPSTRWALASSSQDHSPSAQPPYKVEQGPDGTPIVVSIIYPLHHRSRA